MKKIISMLAVLSLLSACAAPVPKYLAQKKSNQEVIGKIRNVEIFYHGDDDLVVMDLGGSSLRGMGGIFGPIGALAAIAADAGSRLSMRERTETRSKEFTKTVRDRFPTESLNLDVANKLAALIQESGRTVKITKIKRPTGDMLVSKSLPEDLAVTDNFAPVVLRISTGYIADSATTSYRPFIKTEYALAKDVKHILVENSASMDDYDRTYLTYPELLANFEEARGELKKGLVLSAATAYKNMFDLSELAGK